MREISFSRTATGAMLIVLLCTVAFNSFYLLGAEPVRDWDEARHGVSAAEMLQSGNYIVNTWQGKPDYWNSKPTLGFLPMMLGFKLWGVTPLGLRFFSAVFTCLTIMGMALFCLSRNAPLAGVISAAILATSKTFIIRHNARTGDPEAFFIFLYAMALILVLWQERSMARYYGAAFLAGLAFLTKSFHAGSLCLILMLYFLMDFGLSWKSFRNGLLCLLCAFIPVGLWAALRYQYDGSLFFEHMIRQDLLSRVSEGMEGHLHGPLFYFPLLWQGFDIWIVTLGLFGVAALYSWKKNPEPLPGIDKRLLLKLALAALLPIVLYSLSSTKLKWYIYGAYPGIALFTGFALQWAIQRTVPAKRHVLVLGMLAILFVAGEVLVVKDIHKRGTRANPVQQAMRELGNDPANKGAALYLSGRDWGQADILCATMFGPFVLHPGGEEAHQRASGGKSFLLDSGKTPTAPQDSD